MIGYKGELVLYSLDYKVLVSGFYKNRVDRKMLMKNWLERHQCMAYYFVIRPLDERIYIRNRHVVPETLTSTPKVMIRPPSVYTNNASPFGIFDQLKIKTQ